MSYDAFGLFDRHERTLLVRPNVSAPAITSEFKCPSFVANSNEQCTLTLAAPAKVVALPIAMIVAIGGGVLFGVLAYLVRTKSDLIVIDNGVAKWGNHHASTMSTHVLDAGTGRPAPGGPRRRRPRGPRRRRAGVRPGSTRALRPAIPGGGLRESLPPPREECRAATDRRSGRAPRSCASPPASSAGHAVGRTA